MLNDSFMTGLMKGKVDLLLYCSKLLYYIIDTHILLLYCCVRQTYTYPSLASRRARDTVFTNAEAGMMPHT